MLFFEYKHLITIFFSLRLACIFCRGISKLLIAGLFFLSKFWGAGVIFYLSVCLFKFECIINNKVHRFMFIDEGFRALSSCFWPLYFFIMLSLSFYCVFCFVFGVGVFSYNFLSIPSVSRSRRLLAVALCSTRCWCILIFSIALILECFPLQDHLFPGATFAECPILGFHLYSLVCWGQLTRYLLYSTLMNELLSMPSIFP